MQTVTVDRPREEADAVVRAAFEQTELIRVYHVGENRAIGKTGVRRVSWGEQVAVEFAGTGDGGTEFSVRGKKEVRENVTADPEAVESAVLDRLARANPGEDTTGAGEDPGEDTTGAGEEPGENTTGAGEEPGENTTGAGEEPGENTAGVDGSGDTREVPHREDLPSGRRAALLFLGVFLPLLSVFGVLLGTRTVGAIASGSFASLLFSLGAFLLFAVLVGGVGMLATWYDEGTLRQRLPV